MSSRAWINLLCACLVAVSIGLRLEQCGPKTINGIGFGHMTDGHCFEDLHVGQSASLSKTITDADIRMYSAVSLDTNPIHLDEELARRSRFGGRIAHGMLPAGLISAVLGTRLPGPGTIYLRQSLIFRAPVRIGQTVEAIVEITGLNPARKSATLRTRCMVKEEMVIDGEAVVLVRARA